MLENIRLSVEKGDYIRLEARNTDGDTDQSSFYICPVITYQNEAPVTDTEVPKAPAEISSVSAENSITLKWSEAADNRYVMGYHIYQLPTEKARAGKTPIATVGADTFAYVVENLAPGTEYRFEVTAFDAAGNESEGVQLAAKTEGTAEPPKDVEKPSAPKVKAEYVKTDSAVISWEASTDNVGVAGYEIYQDGKLLATVTDKLYWQAGGLKAGTEYTYEVKAYDAAGNRSDAGSVTFITEKETETPGPTPGGDDQKPGEDNQKPTPGGDDQKPGGNNQKPTSGEDDRKPDGKAQAVKTGDNMSVMLPITAMAGSLLVIGGAAYAIKRSKRAGRNGNSKSVR